MVINTGLSNYYGHVSVYEDDGVFYIALDDYSGVNRVEISEKLYLTMLEEFGE